MRDRYLFFAACACLCTGAVAWVQPGQPPGGGFQPFAPPKPGEILPGFVQDSLKLTDEQKKQLEKLQKEVEANLNKLLTAEQKKALEELQQGFGFGPGFGPGGKGKGKGPGAGPGQLPPGGMPGGPPGGFGPGGFGKKGGFGPGGITVADLQKKIGATDEEWKVISPKLQKVLKARRSLNGADGSTGVVAQAQADLRTVLEDQKQTKADVEEKIAAVRKAREQARSELEEACRDLSRLLTPSQQTIMISLGHLE